MSKFILSFLIAYTLSQSAFAAEDITGMWTTIDDETGTPKSVVQVYEYQNKIYGRIVKLFKNQDKLAVGLKGDPKILGLDIIWNLKEEDNKFNKGKILDPTKGKIYSSEAYIKDDKLIVRGKIGPFGRNQTWIRNTDTAPQNNLIPKIPEKK